MAPLACRWRVHRCSRSASHADVHGSVRLTRKNTDRLIHALTSATTAGISLEHRKNIVPGRFTIFRTVNEINALLPIVASRVASGLPPRPPLAIPEAPAGGSGARGQYQITPDIFPANIRNRPERSQTPVQRLSDSAGTLTPGDHQTRVSGHPGDSQSRPSRSTRSRRTG